MSDAIQDIARQIDHDARRRAVLMGIVAALVFMVLQVIGVLIGIRLMYDTQGSLADRVDRNLAYTICIIATHPDTRSHEDYIRCFREANALYPHLDPPLPRPVPDPSEIRKDES